MLTAPGSPPHVREKHVNECIHTILNGITPASAGKTLRPAIIFVRYQDHPRVCGKNRGIVQLVDVSTGSPPRLREKYIRHLEDGKSLGITPASAGKTDIHPVRTSELWDHSRVCGKNI